MYTLIFIPIYAWLGDFGGPLDGLAKQAKRKAKLERKRAAKEAKLAAATDGVDQSEAPEAQDSPE